MQIVRFAERIGLAVDKLTPDPNPIRPDPVPNSIRFVERIGSGPKPSRTRSVSILADSTRLRLDLNRCENQNVSPRRANHARTRSDPILADATRLDPSRCEN